MSPHKLTPSQINEHLKKIPTWSYDSQNKTLERVIHLPDFKTALEVTNLIGTCAEKHNHHPEITLGWGKVKVTLTTHEVHNITQRDVELAHEIEKLLIEHQLG